jgi:CheY-like chemotaxis protein
MTDGAPRVLLVDDNAVVRGAVAGLFEHQGAICDLATDGAEAIRAASRNTYDLVLMDIRMRGIDGPQATARILAASAGRTPPRIVGLTGALDEELRATCLRAGMSAVFEKPLRLAQVESLLQTLRSTA